MYHPSEGRMMYIHEYFFVHNAEEDMSVKKSENQKREKKMSSQDLARSYDDIFF